jgi:hypothetical protein
MLYLIVYVGYISRKETRGSHGIPSYCKGGLLNRVGPVNWVRRRRYEGSSRLETRLNLEDL